MLALLFPLISLVFSCNQCIFNGQPFSCGARIFMGNVLNSCCDGQWSECLQFGKGGEWICHCPRHGSLGHANAIQNVIDINAQVDQKPLINEQYKITKAGRLYTEYVTLAKLVKNTYIADKVAHSSKIALGDLVLWPGFDGKDKQDGNIVLQVESYNITADKANCCWSIAVGFPPNCQYKYCCGSGCCC